jgi:Terminase large subunit, T4likevirus-type, N-terminal
MESSLALPPLPPKKTARKTKRDEVYEAQKAKRTQDKKEEQAKARKEAALLKEQEKIEQQAKALNAVKKKYGIVTDAEVTAAPPAVKEEIQQRIAFRPNSDKQLWFLEASEDEVLFSGGRGSGKSLCLIADPLRYINNGNFRAVIIRRTMPELRDLMDRAKNMYFQIVPSVQWKVKEGMFVFPSGAKIEFGYLDSENDLEKYRGQEYTWIGIDEISQLPYYEWYYKIKGSLRTSDKTLKTYVRCTSNPVGVGRDWVAEYFKVQERAPNTTIRETFDTPIGKITTTKKWIQSTVFDNKDLLEADPTYIAKLLSGNNPALMQALLHGDWDAVEGAAFQEFNKAIHVCKPFPIPNDWPKVRGADYGYKDGASCVWIAIDPVTQVHYVYRDFYCNGRNADLKDRFDGPSFSRHVKHLESGEYVKYGVIDSSIWSTRGQSGPTIAEDMIKTGVKWRPSDKGNGSRIAGKNKIHQLLQVDPELGIPNLIIFETCTQTIKSLAGIPICPHNAEDVDTKSPLDCVYDALRYVVQSRPFNANAHLNFPPPPPINPIFGY